MFLIPMDAVDHHDMFSPSKSIRQHVTVITVIHGCQKHLGDFLQKIFKIFQKLPELTVTHRNSPELNFS